MNSSDFERAPPSATVLSDAALRLAEIAIGVGIFAVHASIPGQVLVEVGDAVDADGAFVQVRLGGGLVERRIASVTGPHDADAFGVDLARCDRGLQRVLDILDDASAPFAVAGMSERATEAARAAVVRLQDGIAPAREKLRPGIEFERVADFRAAVRHDNQRRRTPARRRGRQRQITAEIDSVPRLEIETARVAERGALQRGRDFAQYVERLGLEIVDIEGFLDRLAASA